MPNRVRIVRSPCRGCHGVCQVLVHLKGDRVVKVTGDPDSPTSRGYLCPKGSAAPELLYHPDRLTHPLRRVGESNPDPLVEIHPDTASSLGIKEGDWVWMESLVARVKVKAKLFEGIRPDVVNAQHAWWFPEEKPSQYGWKRSNVNPLYDHTQFDPKTASEPLKSCLCKVYKA